MRQANHQRQDARSEEAARLGEAEAILRRVREETEPQAGALAARLAGGFGKHLAGADADLNDPVEVWGTRIGRGLGLLAFVGLGLLLAWQVGA